MDMKTSELSGAAIDWAVAKADEQPHRIVSGLLFIPGGDNWNPSSNWEQGGPIIEREGIQVKQHIEEWVALPYDAEFSEESHYSGPTPLIAAMRCYVASKLGDEIEIPKELT
jgi:hypothetical protein